MTQKVALRNAETEKINPKNAFKQLNKLSDTFADLLI